MSLRTALGLIRDGDPGAWRCFLCGHWTDRNECFNHRVRVFRGPVGPRPIPPVQPPRPVNAIAGPQTATPRGVR